MLTGNHRIDSRINPEDNHKTIHLLRDHYDPFWWVHDWCRDTFVTALSTFQKKLCTFQQKLCSVGVWDIRFGRSTSLEICS